MKTLKARACTKCANSKHNARTSGTSQNLCWAALFKRAEEKVVRPQVKEKAKEVAHTVKHYGAFGEDYLGFVRRDPLHLVAPFPDKDVELLDRVKPLQ